MDDLWLGTGIAIGPLYDPIRLAEDSAEVNLVSNGRLKLGLGLGYRDNEMSQFGIPIVERVAHAVDTIEILRRAWTERLLGYEPEFHPSDATVDVTPKPVQKPGPDVLMGGAGDPAVRRAGRLGDW